MKKLMLIALLACFAPTVSYAQKHAAPPKSQKKVYGLYPEGTTRLLTADDVRGLNAWDLKVMRNEIFARHGYIFQTDDLIHYFNGQMWYTPIYSRVDKFLTRTEKKNIEFIKRYE